MREKPYDDCLLEHLITPLGLTHAATDPYGAIMFRAAVGHVRHTPQADWEPAPVWALPRSNGPAGSMLAMRPRDLLAFASMHMDGGSTAEGTRIIEAGTAEFMMQRQVDLPDLGYMGTAWGLGWEMFGRPPGGVVGHDGNTLGQAAFLRIVPERGVAVCLLTNGGDSLSLYHDLVGHLLAELADVRLSAFPTPPDEPERIDARRYVGTYSAEVMDFDLSQDDDGRVWVVRTPKGIFAEMGAPPERQELVAYGRDRLLPREPEESMHLPHVFLGDDGSGRAQYLHVGRAIRRAEAR